MNNFHLERYQENLEGGVFERTLMRELVKNFLSKSSCEWIWSSIVSKRIFHSQVIKVKPDVSRSEGHMEDSYWWEVSPHSLGVSGFPLIQPPWLSLWCVCLCFPSTEPSVFPLSIFSAGTLDHPGIQSWTEVSGAVWHISGFALRSVSFWK